LSFPRLRLLLRSTAVRVILAVLAVEAGVVGLLYWSEVRALKGQENSLSFRPPGAPSHSWWKFDHEGISEPPVVAASAATLGDDEEILGVVVNGHARGYQLSALKQPLHHIVNDVIAGRPVSVLYCDLSQCATAYGGEPGSAALPIRHGGERDGKLVLQIQGAYYEQDSGTLIEPADRPRSIPYAPVPLERKTWREWKKEHPDTQVYVGGEAK
jgi:uncharacterized protein DUF3179